MPKKTTGEFINEAKNKLLNDEGEMCDLRFF